MTSGESAEGRESLPTMPCLACGADVPRSQKPQSFADGRAAQREFPKLVLIAGSTPDRLREDRRIGRDPDDLAVVDQLGEAACFDQRAAEVVQPYAYTRFSEII